MNATSLAVALLAVLSVSGCGGSKSATDEVSTLSYGRAVSQAQVTLAAARDAAFGASDEPYSYAGPTQQFCVAQGKRPTKTTPIRGEIFNAPVTADPGKATTYLTRLAAHEKSAGWKQDDGSVKSGKVTFTKAAPGGSEFTLTAQVRAADKQVTLVTSTPCVRP